MTNGCPGVPPKKAVCGRGMGRVARASGFVGAGAGRSVIRLCGCGCRLWVRVQAVSIWVYGVEHMLPTKRS
eukprot:4964393-Alexandrium_andersonii.AAC.1